MPLHSLMRSVRRQWRRYEEKLLNILTIVFII
jgi:hypothetical protein